MRWWMRVGVAAAAMAAVVSAWGQFGPFEAKPGVTEFTGRLIVKPRANASARAVSALLGSRAKLIEATGEYLVTLPIGLGENAKAALLGASGLFAYAEPDWLCFPLRRPNDPIFPSMWHHGRMESEAGWDLIVGRATQIVAVADTGVDLNHPDLRDLLVPGYNSASDRAQVDGGDVNDINGHGTHVAGCVTAIGDNATGVAGVGWNFRIMPIRVTNRSDGAASISDILEGARWAIDNGARSVSASYSGVAAGPIQTTGAYIRSKNGLFFYAAGNDGANHNRWDHADVVVVGATSYGDERAGWSAYGVGVDLFAPGVDIWSTTPGGGYAAWSGTSMATPVAHGVAALIWAANPSLTSYEVEALLEWSCDDLGARGEDDEFGWGRVNVYRAALVGARPRIAVRSETGHAYEFVPGWVDWPTARAQAAQRRVDGKRGYLATLTSPEELAFVREAFGEGALRSVWIGAYQDPNAPEPSGGWRWVSGERFSWAPWLSGEPNDWGGLEDHVQLGWRGTDLRWNDMDGYNHPVPGYLVEYGDPGLGLDEKPLIRVRR